MSNTFGRVYGEGFVESLMDGFIDGLLDGLLKRDLWTDLWRAPDFGGYSSERSKWRVVRWIDAAEYCWSVAGVLLEYCRSVTDKWKTVPGDYFGRLFRTTIQEALLRDCSEGDSSGDSSGDYCGM